jgi:hypothetical protein
MMKTTIALMIDEGGVRAGLRVGELRPVAERESETAAGRTRYRVDDRCDDLADERADHRSERGADDDRDREIDDVAPQDEFLEAFQHVSPYACHPRRIRQMPARQYAAAGEC